MRRQSQHRYDVQAWVNATNEIEVKVFDHRHHRVVAHLVEQEIEKLREGDVYASIYPDERREIELGKTDYLSLMHFEEIDREAPEHSENTLYWVMDDDSFGWARHPLHSWQSAIAEGGLIGFENQLRESQLNNVFSGLRQEYMDEIDKEVADL